VEVPIILTNPFSLVDDVQRTLHNFEIFKHTVGHCFFSLIMASNCSSERLASLDLPTDLALFTVVRVGFLFATIFFSGLRLRAARKLLTKARASEGDIRVMDSLRLPSCIILPPLCRCPSA